MPVRFSCSVAVIAPSASSSFLNVPCTLLKKITANATITGMRAVETIAIDPSSEIRIGNTASYSGPASAYGIIAKTEAALFKMVNDHGGVGCRQINYISLDDVYSPPRTVDQVRRLVEQDQGAFMFATICTPSNTAIFRYTNGKGVPLLFLGSGAN